MVTRQPSLFTGGTRSERSGFRPVVRRRSVRPRNEAVSETAGGERHILEGYERVPAAQREPEAPPESTDTCWRPRGTATTLGRHIRVNIGVTAT